MGSVVSGIGDVIGSVASGVGDFVGDVASGAGDFLGGVSSGLDKYGGLVSTGLGLLGTYSDYQASKDTAKAAERAMQTADPFGPYRNQFAQQLVGLYQNPWSVADLPGYQFRLAQGLEGIDRNASAKGLLGSGNRLMELMRYGQDYASQEFGNEIGRLSGLAGATMGSPSDAAQLQVLAGNLDANRFGNVLGNVQGVFDQWRNSRQPQGLSPTYQPGMLGVNMPGGGIMYY